MLSLSLSS